MGRPHRIPRFNKLTGVGDYKCYEIIPYSDWAVEAVNYDLGCSYLTLFTGPSAEERARKYRDLMQNELERYRNGYRAEGNAGC